MAHGGRLPCFICPTAMPPQQMRRIDRPEDEKKREIAIVRQDNAGRESLQVTQRFFKKQHPKIRNNQLL